VQAALAADPWPVGYSYAIGGLYESQQASFRSMLLGARDRGAARARGAGARSFRRFTPALVILSAAPLSLVGAFGLLLVTGTPAQRLLVHGPDPADRLVVKIRHHPGDYADIARARRASPIEALVEAGTVRLRPILMTTLCTLFGLLPLALGSAPARSCRSRSRSP
jgi:multidrug efflux pump subunit AcrB